MIPCPLTKKLSVYNLNGRFIWTVRYRITTKKSRKTHLKSYKLICILMSQISICKPWEDKTLVGNHRGQMFLVVGHQVCTHLRRDSLLFADQVMKVLRLTFGNLNFQLHPQIFYGIKVWRLARSLQDLNVLLFWVTPLLPWPCVLGHCHAAIPIHNPFSMPWLASMLWPWRYMAPSIVPLTRCSWPVLLTKKNTNHNISTSMFDGGDGVLRVSIPPPNMASWVDAKELDFGLIWPQHFHSVLLRIIGKLQTGLYMCFLEQGDLAGAAGFQSFTA